MQAKEICQQLDQLQKEGAGLDKLLNAAVELLHRSNPRFHWTGIYELFPDNVLRLGPFLGAPTDHCFIGVGQGVCGTAVAEKRNLNIPDVSKVSNYLACSTATRSELVILIRKGEAIFAQIDIDSHELAAFDEAAVRLVEKVADWLASVYERHHKTNAPATQGAKGRN
ncbi:MAG TPA: GAF domain-containing protein [candidate division Zixibacteria bacterium]|nr:GAF domain-containing protein [candidate division Zixibacteria bacterium]